MTDEELIALADDSALVERVARAIFANRGVFDDMCYVENELFQRDADLTATVDGVVNFTALAKAAIRALVAERGK